MIATPADLMRRWRVEGARPRTLQAVLQWVAWALRGQRTAEATQVLRELLAAREHPALWGYLAQAETAAGRPAKAAEALVRHLKLEERPQPAVYVAAVDAFVEAGRKDRARALAERAPSGELKDFLLQRLRQDTGRAPRRKAPKTVAALGRWERSALMQVLSSVSVPVLAKALGCERSTVQEAFLDCFEGGPRRRLAALLRHEVDRKERDAARKALLKAAMAAR